VTQPSLCVALTGATGFVGRHTLVQLMLTGHRVRVLARDPSRLTVTDARVRAVQGDLFSDHALSELVQGADAVIHLVGIIREIPRLGQTFERIHAEGTRRLLAAAKGAAVHRWVQMSALGTRPNPVSRYHATKWQAEEAVRHSGIPFTILRPSIIHGEDGEFIKMVKGFCCHPLPPFMPYFGAGPLGRGGAGRLQPIWVKDVARCLVEALTNPRAVNETYPLGGPDVYTWPQLYLTCQRYFPAAKHGRKPLAIPVWLAKLIAGLPLAPFNRDQVVMSQEDSTCQITKAQEDFGFPLAPFEPTLAEYAPRV
jgi:NADH dehydrogenase